MQIWIRTLHRLHMRGKDKIMCHCVEGGTWWCTWLMSQFSSSLIGPPAGFLHIVWLNTGSNQERCTLSAKLHQRAHTESTMPHTRLCHLVHMQKETYAHANFSFMQYKKVMRKTKAKHAENKRQQDSACNTIQLNLQQLFPEFWAVRLHAELNK